ncbi:type II toxin-antitoxin system RelB/DinJ family antitoxin [Moraxella lincolnii]|uniref:Translation repressor RelB n=1 Tax=Lwoffella lincolnii TaxID=90241 RepID=A0A1T0CE38_9GAMM|nr:type II toxin-antitoxin system RelB/DinJ family antitoxin [Moraxella lincolnii]OOS20618.1 translation repressor RelB [Moraxella lincolnii]
MYDSSFSFRTHESIKNQAFDVIRSYGLSPAQTFNMFLTQIAISKQIPLSLDYQPNTVTADAIKELIDGQGETFEANDVADFQQHMMALTNPDVSE